MFLCLKYFFWIFVIWKRCLCFFRTAGHGDCDVVLFEGQGVPDAADWEPEISLLVLGIGREQAVAIGRDFGQLAIVCGRPGGVAELVACTQSKS